MVLKPQKQASTWDRGMEKRFKTIYFDQRNEVLFCSCGDPHPNTGSIRSLIVSSCCPIHTRAPNCLARNRKWNLKRGNSVGQKRYQVATNYPSASAAETNSPPLPPMAPSNQAKALPKSCSYQPSTLAKHVQNKGQEKVGKEGVGEQ